MLEGVDSQQFQSPLGNARSQSSPENVGSQQFQTTLEDVYAQSLKSSHEDSCLHVLLPAIEDVYAQLLQLIFDVCRRSL
jgi:hypothetical protein